MRFLCRIGWHLWGSWSALRQGTISSALMPEPISVMIQSRRCESCGREQVEVAK